MCRNNERVLIELGDGSEVEYFPHLFSQAKSFEWMNYLDQHIPWTRPSLHIFGRICSQPRETCYIAKAGLPAYRYSGYEPKIHSWDDYPPLKDILKAVHDALPGATFNSLLLNRYKCGSDYVSWHSDNEPLYGPTPTIASVTLGAEREFLLRKKKKISRGEDINPLNNSVHSTENKNTNASELKLEKARTNLISVGSELISVGSEPCSSSKRDYDSALSISTTTIASVTLDAEREFLLMKKTKISRGEDINPLNRSVHSTENKNTNASELNLEKARTNFISVGSEPWSSSERDYGSALSVSTNIFDKLKTRQRDVKTKQSKDCYSFMLNHGSLFVMRGSTQRDWEHFVPKRMKMQGLRINLTFRYVLES